jgi:hypothetical protein
LAEEVAVSDIMPQQAMVVPVASADIVQLVAGMVQIETIVIQVGMGVPAPGAKSLLVVVVALDTRTDSAHGAHVVYQHIGVVVLVHDTVVVNKLDLERQVVEQVPVRLVMPVVAKQAVQVW